MKETVLGERVVVFSRGGESVAESYGANATAIRGDEGILLVDPLIAPSEAAEVERLLAARSNLPIRAVVLTHHHTDHALGAGLFARRGVAVLAHRAGAARMAVEHPGLVAERRRKPDLAALFADAEPFAPTVLLDGDSISFDLGGIAAEVIAAGHAHTPGDVFVHVPAIGLVVAGDLVSSGYHVNYEDADVGGWRRALQAIRALAPKIVVPGHGGPGGAELIDAQVAYHDAVESIVRDGREDAVERIRERFSSYRLAILLQDTVALLSS